MSHYGTNCPNYLDGECNGLVIEGVHPYCPHVRNSPTISCEFAIENDGTPVYRITIHKSIIINAGYSISVREGSEDRSQRR